MTRSERAEEEWRPRKKMRKYPRDLPPDGTKRCHFSPSLLQRRQATGVPAAPRFLTATMGRVSRPSGPETEANTETWSYRGGGGIADE
jgi:hypothetical protein